MFFNSTYMVFFSFAFKSINFNIVLWMAAYESHVSPHTQPHNTQSTDLLRTPNTVETQRNAIVMAWYRCYLFLTIDDTYYSVGIIQVLTASSVSETHTYIRWMVHYNHRPVIKYRCKIGVKLHIYDTLRRSTPISLHGFSCCRYEGIFQHCTQQTRTDAILHQLIVIYCHTKSGIFRTTLPGHFTHSTRWMNGN